MHTQTVTMLWLTWIKCACVLETVHRGQCQAGWHWPSSPMAAPAELFSLWAALSLALLFVIQLLSLSFLSLFWTVVKLNVTQQTREGQLIPGTQQLTLEWRGVEIIIMAAGSWDTTLGKEWGIEFYLSIAVRPALPEQDTQSCRLTLVWRTWLIFLQPSPYCFTRLLGEVLLWCSSLFLL